MVSRNGAQVAYLGLGSSLGDRMDHLERALQALDQVSPAVRVTAVSPVYESPHLGLQPGDAERLPAHLNCVVRIETTLEPVDLLNLVQSIERADNRDRSVRWGPRTIDIDVLIYGELEFRSEALTIPHPGIRERAFVIRPLMDLAPDLRLPGDEELADLVDSDAIRSQRIVRLNECLGASRHSST